MTIYAGALLGLVALSVFISPMMVGTERDKWYPASEFLVFLLLIPVFGRVLGWW